MKTKTLVSIGIVSLLILISLPSPVVSLRCNQDDYKVLLKLKPDLGNPTWVEGTECCDWYGVECDFTTNRINNLFLFQADGPGQIPTAVGDLPYLKILDLRKLTNLTGEIPEAIAKLTNLEFLRLTWTNLSGPVPSFLSKLKKLYFLDLAFNNLTGSIPSSLSKLQNLGAIHLDRNKLTGKIPSSFGEFTGNIPEIYLSHNQLSGSVPKSMGNLNFSTLDFSRNNLTGDLSFLFGKNKTVLSVDMSRNEFQFDLTNVSFPDSLTALDLNHNKIYGSLPAELTELNLQYLNVSYNRLCGQIPTGGKLQSFDEYSYFHNRCLCGSPLPACK